MSLDPDLVDAVVGAFTDFHGAKFFRLSGATWLVWDTILTLPTEIQLLWDRRRLSSVPVLLYFVVRYLPTISQVFVAYGTMNPTSPALCTAWFAVSAWSQCTTVICIHAVLVYRLHALYSSRAVLAGMVAWTALNAIATITIDAWTESRSIRTNQVFPGVPVYGCTTALNSPSRQDSDDFLWLGWIPVLLTDTVLFALSAWKLRDVVRRSHWNGSRTLSQVLVQDSCKYYAVLFSVVLFQVIVWSVFEWEQFTDPYTSAVLPIVGTRLLLNLRQAATESELPTTLASGSGVELSIRSPVSAGADSTRKSRHTLTFPHDISSTTTATVT